MTKLLSFISYKIIPFLTGERHAPDVYITNAFYLNWRQLSKSMKNALPYLKGNCIDVGAGTAPYQDMISKKVDRYTVADHTDTRASMFALASSEFVEADVLDLPFEDESADTIIFTQVLEHVSDPNLALDQITRVLKTDGILVISVPFIFQAHAQPHDYWRFSQRGIKKLLQDRNYEIKLFHYQGYLGTALINILNGFIWELSSKNKLIRNFILLPVLLVLFSINNIFGLVMDLIKLQAYSPNFFIVAQKKEAT
ncbi:class I SAM-dependent methyltransferase [Sulfurimonas sp.]|uniref:class I SAM-dependent methyltransferase n=1 Tax=Sulfurimonas sp. TaxID=2022749 RepID=UPI00356A2EAD